jgi:hypothetical protein
MPDLGIGEIIAAITGGLGSVSSGIAGGLTGLGLGEGVAGAVGSATTGALTGGALGAGEAALTGGNVLKGAELGGLTGGAIGGLGGPLTSALGGTGGALGAAAPILGNALAGAGGGALGGVLTGGNIGKDALLGGAGGAITGAVSNLGATSGTPRTVSSTPGGGAGGGGVGASTVATPASLSSSAPDIAVGDPSSTLPGTLGGSADIPTPVSRDAEFGGSSVNSAINSGQVAPAGAPTPTATAKSTNPLSGASNILSSIAPLALGASLLKKPAGLNQLTGVANEALAKGNQLQNYATSGTLPPGQQAALDSAINATIAGIRGKYAQVGQSGSSAEMQEVSAARERAVAMGGNIAAQLSAQGLSETQLASGIYEQLMNVQIQQDQALSQGIGNLANSMALMAGRRVA